MNQFRQAIHLRQANDCREVSCCRQINGRGTRQTCLTLILLLSMATFAHAQQLNPAIESSIVQPAVLVGRPMLTWWDVKIDGSGLLVGQFQFAIKHNEELLATFETEELTLSGPERRIRVLLPAISSYHLIDQLQVDVSFQGKRFRGPLGQHILRCPFMGKKVFIAAVADSRMTVNWKRGDQMKVQDADEVKSHREQILQRLRPERVLTRFQAGQNANDDLDLIKTIYAPIVTTDLPSEPLAYCGYDCVIVADNEFRQLRKPQLEAILAWVKAGGSIYLEPSGVLEPYHIDFLQSLTIHAARQVDLKPDSTGKLPFDLVESANELAIVDCGIGRAVIRIASPDQPISADEQTWDPAVKSLWNLRKQPFERKTISQPVVGSDGSSVTQNEIPNPDPYGIRLARLNSFRMPQGALLDRLMPEGVGMIPFSVLTCILLVFILLIGPGDYFLLGRLRARKLTWLTFPVVTIAVTAFTVWLSDRYMASSEGRRVLVLNDIGRDGEVARSNRFELLFASSSGPVTTKVERGLFTAVGTGVNETVQDPRMMYQAGGQLVAVAPGAGAVRRGRRQWSPLSNLKNMPREHGDVELQGRMPTQFAARQVLSKWTPQLNRVLTVSTSSEIPQIDWSNLELSKNELSNLPHHQLPGELVGRVRAQFGSQAMVACFSGITGWAYDGAAGWRSIRNVQNAIQTEYQTQRDLGLFGAVERYDQAEAPLFRWIYAASVAAPNPGEYSIISTKAPNGNAFCDDLPILDSTDADTWLLVVVVPVKNEFIVYRKQMRSEQ